MFNPEDFRHQLDKGVVDKRQTNQEKRNKEKETQQFAKQEAEQARRGERNTERERNRLVVGADKQLPIGEYLGVLKNKIVPLEYVRRSGPKNGEIAHYFIYSSSFDIINEKIMGGGNDSFRVNNFYYMGDRFGFKVDRKVLTAVIDYKKQLTVGTMARSIEVDIRQEGNVLNGLPRLCVNKIEGINPLKTGRPDDMGVFNLNFSEGLQRFAQVLTDFYVGLKTGQIK